MKSSTALIYRIPQALLILGVLIGTFGCTSYKIGPAAALPFKTLYVEPARNDSYAPQAQALLTQQLIQQLLQQHNLTLKSSPQSDATLHVTITDFDRDVSATQQIDTALARSYRVTLTAQCDLIDNKSGKVYFKNRSVSATIDSFVDDGFQPSDYQNMPTLTRKLAEKIKNTVISTW